MAKKGNNKKTPQQKAEQRSRNNFFTSGAQKDGENFLDNMRPDVMQRNCSRIFKEMVSGNINYERDLKYLAHPQMLNTLITTSYNLYNDNAMYSNLLDYYIQNMNNAGQYVDPWYIEARTKHKALTDIFSIINVSLNQFMYSNDVAHLLAMSNTLNSYSDYRLLL